MGSGGAARWLGGAHRRYRLFTALAVLIALAVPVAIVLGVFEPRDRAWSLKQWHSELAYIADTRRTAISEWVDARLGDAEVLANEPAVGFIAAADAAERRSSPALRAALTHLNEYLAKGAAVYRYRSIACLDVRGEVFASVGTGVDEPIRELVRRAVGEDKALIELDTALNGTPRVMVARPVRLDDAAGGRPSAVVGVVALDVDPSEWLYPLLRFEVESSSTGELVLFGRVGDGVVCLSPLHCVDAAPLTLREPGSVGRIAVEEALAGRELVGTFVDRRGVAVLAATRAIPHTDWGLVISIEEAEALAAHRARTMRNILVGVIGALLTVLVGALVLRKREAGLLAALDRSQLPYQQLFESMWSCAAVYEAVDGGHDFVIVGFNRAAEKAEAITRDQVLGRRVTEVFPGVERFGLLEVFRRVHATGKPEHHPGGLYQDQRLAGWRDNYVYRLESGEVVAVYEDVTEIMEAEQALGESEDRYRSLSDAAAEGVAIHAEGVILDGNLALATMFGYEPGEMIGMKVLDFAAPESRELVQRRTLERFEGRYQVVGRRKDGTTFVGDLASRGIVWQGRKARVTTVRDLTEQKRAEAERERLLLHVRGLAARLATAEEVERQRLARELHDRVGQSLAVLGLNLSLVHDQLSVESAAKVGGRLDSSMNLLQGTVDELRVVMDELRPPALDDLGLLAAVTGHAAQVERHTGLRLKVLGSEPEPRLPAQTEIALYRIAQEALANTIKHAHASEATIELEPCPQGTRLVVTDNGVGFDVVRVLSRDRPGWGLVGIKERCAAVGGTVEFDSAPGRGTRVVVEVGR